MNDTVKINELGVQINFGAWEKFNLENLGCDGVILFQYLAFHCQNIAQWTHSDNEILNELGIKRSRLTTIEGKLKEAGILQTSVTRNAYNNKITGYRINYTELAKIENLKIIYREKTPKGEIIDLAALSSGYKKIAQNQPKPNTPANKKEIQAKEKPVKEFAAELEAVFNKRRDLFNEKRKDNQRKTVGKIKFSPVHLKKLESTLRAFGGNTQFIRDAFIAYCDELNKVQCSETSKLLTESPRDPIRYFLSYSNNDMNDESYAVISSFGNYYAGNYGRV